MYGARSRRTLRGQACCIAGHCEKSLSNPYLVKLQHVIAREGLQQSCHAALHTKKAPLDVFNAEAVSPLRQFIDKLYAQRHDLCGSLRGSPVQRQLSSVQLGQPAEVTRAVESCT